MAQKVPSPPSDPAERRFPSTITIELDGETYVGSYSVDEGIVAVWTADAALTRDLTDAPAVVLAKQLLRELIERDKPRS